MSVREVEREPIALTGLDPPTSFAHVSALDGIRAIAIVAVMVYHQYGLTTPTVGGGFLGVDVFFVLSGFLITTLLLHERYRDGRIHFGKFWERRARRLLPALFLYVFGMAIVARYVVAPFQASQLRGDGIGTLLYFENWRVATGSDFLLPHTWSLSVEEQWYLIWPLFLTGLLVWSRQRLRRVLAVIALLAVASAIEFDLLFTGKGFRAYTATDTRAQSLLVGAALGVVLFRRPRRYSRWLQIAGWAALAFLVWCFVYVRYGDAELNRGGYLLIAVASAAAIAAVVQSPTAALGRVLSMRLLVAIGLVSYGLYLYHPLIYLWLTPATTHLHGIALLALRIAASATVAVASYFLVEMPFRRGARLGAKRVVALAVGAAIALGALVATTPHAARPPADLTGYAFAVAARNTPAGVRRVIVVGDSSAVDLAVATHGVFNGSSIRGIAYGMPGCDIVGGHRVAADGTPVPKPAACTQLFGKFGTATHSYSPAFAVLMLGPSEAHDRIIGGRRIRFGSADFHSLFVGALDRARAVLSASGARFVLLADHCARAADTPPFAVQSLDGSLAAYAHDHRGTTYLNGDVVQCSGGKSDTMSTWREVAARLHDQ